MSKIGGDSLLKISQQIWGLPSYFQKIFNKARKIGTRAPKFEEPSRKRLFLQVEIYLNETNHLISYHYQSQDNQEKVIVSGIPY